MTNASHDPGLRSWVDTANAADTDFPIQNLPLGVFRRSGTDDAPGIGVAIGEEILDLRAAATRGLLEGVPPAIVEAAAATSLNNLMAIGQSGMSRLRKQLVAVLDATGRYADPQCLVAMDRADMLLPATIGDYTDFYASIFHATRVGELFRPGNPLLPNYRHVPIAYHGRASSSRATPGTPSGFPTHPRSAASRG